MVASLSWLLGKWRSEDGFGHYPTLKDFKYIEELEFTHIGQPNIQFTFYAFNFETKKPMHREVGFIRMDPETKKVAFISAQNTGLVEVEEGELAAPQELHIQSHTVGRMTFGKEPGVKEIKRTFKMVGDELEQVISMATSATAMTEHLRIRYKKMP
ncbi:hypothetical protein NP493_826g00016 [Ridgeia piscesae]|uniref:THAP4-like heme-binding domain-containing protein n=1 Tax=Ridgeia piscesae TaxID=27915 RepID=A0AAD9NP05_RIDPI|nr:hypothetical protein NP493_826g00016 [Ridgeia piscesae]